MSAPAHTPHMDRLITAGSDPRSDLADDLAGLDDAAAGHTVLRVYSWDSPVVVLGYNQPMDDVDLLACRASGTSVLHRGSGGRGVIHHRDLGVSLALPLSHPWASGIRGLYHEFGTAVADAIRPFGYAVTLLRARPDGPDSPVCFEQHGHDGLYLRGKRVFGSAQIRRQHAAMIHGTLLLGFDAELHASVFGVPAARLAERITSLAAPEARGDMAHAIVDTLLSYLARADTSTTYTIGWRRQPIAPAATA